MEEKRAPEAEPEPELEPASEPAPRAVVAEAMPEVGEDEVRALQDALKRRKVEIFTLRQIVVKMDDCARLPPLPEMPADLPPQDVIQSEGGAGKCFTFFYMPPFASYTDEPYLAWAIGVSRLDRVEAVFICEWQEDAETGYWLEAYAELGDGALVEAKFHDTERDRTWRRLKTERAAHEHMWAHWPLSEVARRMGYTTRSSIVSSHSPLFMGGRAFPPDTKGFERTVYVYLQMPLLERVDACAASSDASRDAWIDAQVKALGQPALEALGRKPRLKGERREVGVAMSDAAYETLEKAAVTLGQTRSHIVQHMIEEHCSAPASE